MISIRVFHKLTGFKRTTMSRVVHCLNMVSQLSIIKKIQWFEHDDLSDIRWHYRQDFQIFARYLDRISYRRSFGFILDYRVQAHELGSQASQKKKCVEISLKENNKVLEHTNLSLEQRKFTIKECTKRHQNSLDKHYAFTSATALPVIVITSCRRNPELPYHCCCAASFSMKYHPWDGSSGIIARSAPSVRACLKSIAFLVFAFLCACLSGE